MQGADGVLLDKETSYGKNPVDAVADVSKTIAETGAVIDPKKKFKTLYEILSFNGSTLSKSGPGLQMSSDKDEFLVMQAAKIVLQKNREPIDYIMTLSKEGKIARLLAKYYLPLDVLACCPDSKVVKQLNLLTGIKALKVPNYTSKLLGADHLLKIVMRTNKSMGLGTEGHYILIFKTNK